MRDVTLPLTPLPHLQSNREKPRQIRVKTSYGKLFNLLVKGSDTVSDVKAKMQHKDRIDLGDQVLCLSSKPLDNGRTLSECNVRSQSSLELLPRLRGGMQLKITKDNGKKINVNIESSDTEVSLHGNFLSQTLTITSPVSN